MKKNLAVAILILLALGAAWWWYAKKGARPELDSATAIQQEVENVDIGVLDEEFNELDSDLNTL